MEHSGKILIIGAGISGLLAGNVLSQAGYPVTILEKSRGVGGRMATRRFEDGVFDHGAQFFTVREPIFKRWVDYLVKEGAAQEWARSFSVFDDLPQGADHPRYRGTDGMTSIAKNLSKSLDIQLRTRVRSISVDGELWLARTEDGRDFSAGQLILTAPVLQSLGLLENGQVSLPAREAEQLQGIQYDPCIAVLALLDDPSAIPAPGGIKFKSGPIQWLGDNTQKGISPNAEAVTIHASPEFSRQNYENNQEQLAEQLIAAARPWLGSDIQNWQVHRWCYSQPVQIYPERILEIPGSPAIIFAGDAFGGPRVEGAALSGIAAAQRITNRSKNDHESK